MGPKQEKIILLAALAVSVLAAVAVGIWVYFIAADTRVLRDANAGLHTRIAAAKNKLNKLNDMRTQREEAQAKLVVAEKILPSQAEVETLVDNLSEFAKQSGILIAKAEPVRQTAYAPLATVQNFQEADFNLDLQGNFFQLVEFLNYLENYKRFIRVDSFSIAAGKASGEANSIALSFATFTYIDPTAVSSATPVKGAVR